MNKNHWLSRPLPQRHLKTIKHRNIPERIFRFYLELSYAYCKNASGIGKAPTIAQISRDLKLHRNSVRKYVEVLENKMSDRFYFDRGYIAITEGPWSYLRGPVEKEKKKALIYHLNQVDDFFPVKFIRANLHKSMDEKGRVRNRYTPYFDHRVGAIYKSMVLFIRVHPLVHSGKNARYKSLKINHM